MTGKAKPAPSDHDEQRRLAPQGNVNDQDVAADELLPMLYQELRSLANRELRTERANHTLQATALVHEAFLRINELRLHEWRDRNHFYGVASGVMRRVLIDHARKRSARKRQVPVRLNMDQQMSPAGSVSDAELLSLDELLDTLGEANPRHAKVVEMRFFAGMTIEETAAALGVSAQTVKTDWRTARAWLKARLVGG